ncbi:MAG: hypothetical protein H0V09_03205 [Gemmatimonadetes bacterium]|nr:hypothetical protein [Gemmatimonadota bacterium]
MRLSLPPARSQAVLCLALLLAAGCGGSEHDREQAQPAGAGSAGAGQAGSGVGGGLPGTLGALSESRKLQIRTALSNLNRSLLNFHVINGRYPADEAELRSSPETAGELAILEGVAETVRYRLDRGTYTFDMTLRDGTPLSMSGSDPTVRPGAAPPPPARGT